MKCRALDLRDKEPFLTRLILRALNLYKLWFKGKQYNIGGVVICCCYCLHLLTRLAHGAAFRPVFSAPKSTRLYT